MGFSTLTGGATPGSQHSPPNERRRQHERPLPIWKSTPDLDLSSAPLAAVDKTIRLHSAPVRHFKQKIAPQEYWPAPWKFEPSSAALASRSSISLRTIDVCSSFGVIENLDLDRRTIFSDLRTLEITGGDLPMQTYIPPCPKLERLTLDLRFHCFVRCDLATIARDFPRLTHLKLGTIARDFPRLARDFPRLTHLKLGGGCDLNIVPAALASLRVLHLFDVYIDVKLSALLSSCPLLQMLSLKHVDLGAEKGLPVAAPNLRRIAIWRMADVHDFGR